MLNRNNTAADIIPAETYEQLVNLEEKLELGQIIWDRKAEKAVWFIFLAFGGKMAKRL